MQEILYLCDDNVETCSKTGCYKRGWECRHTTDVAHAINLEGSRRFVPDQAGNLWETNDEQGWCSASAAPYFIFLISSFSHSNSRWV